MIWLGLAAALVLVLIINRGPVCPYCGARTRPPLFTSHNQVQHCMHCGNTFDYADVDVYRHAEEVRKQE